MNLDIIAKTPDGARQNGTAKKFFKPVKACRALRIVHNFSVQKVCIMQENEKTSKQTPAFIQADALSPNSGPC